MDGNPIEESGDAEVRHQDHNAEQKNKRVPVDRAIGVVERKHAREHHRDSPAKGRGRAIEIAGEVAFHRDQNVRDQKNDDWRPMDRRQVRKLHDTRQVRTRMEPGRIRPS